MRCRFGGSLLRGMGRENPAFRLLGVVLVGLLTTVSWAAKHEKADGPTPSVRIPADQLGYHPLSAFYLMSRVSSSSLDFIDDQHLLFTFRVAGLLKRLPECQPDDEDQLIRALVVHLPDGNVERSAEWRMHDRGRYLWPLGDGKFLVRQRDALQTTDSSLELQPFIQVGRPIHLVKLSPDARLLLIETELEKHTEEEHRKLVEAALAEGLSPPSEDVQFSVLRLEDHSVVMRARSRTVGDLPLISEGYMESLAAKGDHWMLRYKPFKGDPSIVGEVASSCPPSESSLSSKTVFVGTCPEHGSDHIFQAMTLAGKTLWSYRWDSHYIWPTTATSQNGRRIAFSTLRVTHPVSAFDPIGDDDLQAQRIEVLDVETGRLELTEFATPILSAGQNYALSPDGGRFAVQRENAIEIYDLPSVSASGSAE
jgi:hypothetical protein